jgi:hypothetical protein
MKLAQSYLLSLLLSQPYHRFSLGLSVLASVLLHLASMSALKFEAVKKGKIQKQGVKGKS